MNDVDVQVLKGVVYISLADNMLYKRGSYEIGDRAGETLSKIAKIIKDYSNHNNYRNHNNHRSIKSTDNIDHSKACPRTVGHGKKCYSQNERQCRLSR